MTSPLVVVGPVARRFVSMRVHGTSAQVYYEGGPPEGFHIERSGEGTMITSDYQTRAWVHFSIPTPLIVDRIAPFSRAAESDPDRDVVHVFDGSSVWVERIAIHVGIHQAQLREIEVWDGGRRLSQIAKTGGWDSQYFDPDTFEEPPNRIEENVVEHDIDRRVYTGLGISLKMDFQIPEQNKVLFHAAKAVFRI